MNILDYILDFYDSVKYNIKWLSGWRPKCVECGRRHSKKWMRFCSDDCWEEHRW